MAEAHFVRL